MRVDLEGALPDVESLSVSAVRWVAPGCSLGARRREPPTPSDPHHGGTSRCPHVDGGGVELNTSASFAREDLLRQGLVERMIPPDLTPGPAQVITQLSTGTNEPPLTTPPLTIIPPTSTAFASQPVSRSKEFDSDVSVPVVVEGVCGWLEAVLVHLVVEWFDEVLVVVAGGDGALVGE